MKKPTTISKESVSEYREFVQLRLRKRVLEVLALFAVGDVYVSLCKKSAYAPFSARRRS